MSWRWVWATAAVSAVAVAVVVVISLVVSSAPWPEDADVVFVFAGMAPALMGAVLTVRRPENVVGRLLVLIGAAWLLGESSRVYLWMSLHANLPATGAAAWLMSWLFVPAWMLIPLLLAVFPSGTVASRWLRWPILAYVPIVVVTGLSGIVLPQSLEAHAEYLAGFSNPLGIDALAWLEEGPLSGVIEAITIGSVLFLGFAAVTDLVLRWRRSTAIERLQIRAFAYGSLAMIFLFITGALLAALDVPKVLENLTTTAALSAPPLAVGMAVLRYRLYDIDRLISRTVTYAVVIGLLAAVFASVAIGLPQLLGLAEGSPLLVAAATLAVAALFNPLRRRLQGWVDRRFNRARYDAQREAEELAGRLRSESDLDDITTEVLGVVANTLQPETVSMWVRRQP